MNEDLRQVMNARQNVYDLLRCFFLQEPTEIFLQALREENLLGNLAGYHPDLDEGVRLLSGVVTSPGMPLRVPGLLLEFTRLFVGPSPIPLYESLYRSEKPLFMQEETLAVRKKYLEAGLVVHPDRSFPEDHIGAELEFIFFLCRKTAEAEDPEQQETLLRIQQRFFQDHLIHWVTPLCDRLLAETQSPYFQGVARMTRGFISWDFQEIVSRFFDPPELAPDKAS
jgi:TorA maturation chaperone TorD